MRVLVDTSVWVSHFKQRDVRLVALLEAGLVVCHPYVVGPAELATRCFITTFGWIPMAQSLGIQSNGYRFLGD